MAADADADTGRDFRSGNLHDGVTIAGAFAARYDDAGIGHEQAVGTDNLRQFPFVYVLRVDLIVVDNRAQARTGQGNFGVRVFALHEPCVHARSQSIFLIIVQA